MIGLATKAGKTVSGEFAVENAIKSQKARLVLIAEDASHNSQKLFRDKSTYYEVPYVLFGTKEMLGRAVGKQYRSAVAVVDPGFAKTIINKLEHVVTQGKNGGNATV
jgi:ribosomal protein L7Ae-like RNA K-turn-binding protein